eukprot:2439436-Pleurochrysis_carterae.AAC.1
MRRPQCQARPNAQPPPLANLASLSAQCHSSGHSCYPDSGGVADHHCGFLLKAVRFLFLPSESTKPADVVATSGPLATVRVGHRCAGHPDWQ